MFAESYGYYRTPVGPHPRSTGWGVARFDLVAQFEPYRNNNWLAPRPLLMIVGTKADTRIFSEDGVARSGETAELFDIDGATHFDLYYRDEYVLQALEKLVEFYKHTFRSDHRSSVAVVTAAAAAGHPLSSFPGVRLLQRRQLGGRRRHSSVLAAASTPGA